MVRKDEQKLPKYVTGMSYKDFKIKYLTAAGTRGNTRQALEGNYMGLLPGFTMVRGVKFRQLQPWQERIEKENNRAFAELVNSMPNGKLTTLVVDSVTEEFPDGCAGTAWKRVLNEIGKNSTDDKRRLKEMFESEHELSSKKNPAKYIDKLVEIQKDLKMK